MIPAITSQAIDESFIHSTQIARESQVSTQTVHNWAKYHGYFKYEYLKGKLVVKAEEYARFKQFKADHPELFKAPDRQRKRRKRRKAPTR